MRTYPNDIYKEYTCYSNNSEYYNIYPCSICGKNFFEDYNYNDDDINIYIFCSENNKCYSSNEDNNYTYILEYFSCKPCDKNSNQINKECLECETNYISELSKCASKTINEFYISSTIINSTELILQINNNYDDSSIINTFKPIQQTNNILYDSLNINNINNTTESTQPITKYYTNSLINDSYELINS